VHDPTFKARLTADRYWLRYDDPELDYAQVMLVSGRHDWHFVGVTHEYITSDTATTGAELREVLLVHHGDGANRATKFARDIGLLSAELERNPADARTMFYLAESYAHLGESSAALRWYTERAAAGAWEEERWYAGYRAAARRARRAVGRGS
jgi:hypothetical protein